MKNLAAGLVMGLSLVLAVGWKGGGAGAEDPLPGTPNDLLRQISGDPGLRYVPVSGSMAEYVLDIEVRRRMETVISKVNVEGIAFEDFVQYLRELTDLNIRVNWIALEDAAIERDCEVNLVVNEVTIASLLRVVCDAVGAGETELDYDVEDGMINISTKEDLSRRTQVCIYDVSDLIEWSAATRVVRMDDLVGSIARRAAGIFREALMKGWRWERTLDTDMQTIVDIVQQTVDPESWRYAGGNVGNIEPFSNCLVVTQTSTAHGQIRHLLASLRTARELRARR